MTTRIQTTEAPSENSQLHTSRSEHYQTDISRVSNAMNRYLYAPNNETIREATSISETTNTLDWQQPQFRGKESDLGHIFRKAEGHFQFDTPENRAYILQAVSSSKNRVAIDSKANEWYLKVMPDGSQSWAQVRNGLIVNAGRNHTPMRWVADPQKLLGGEFAPLKFHIYSPDSFGFKEQIQVNRLATTYNQSHPKKPIAPHSSELRDIKGNGVKGVSHTAGTILNLLEEFKTTELTEHLLFIPNTNFCLNESEIQQILIDLAKGIYIYDSIPFLSLHSNPQMGLDPVIHPVYQKTFIGYTISLLDYYMKGFCHGVFFDEAFIQEWNKNPITDKEYLRKNSFDFREYCKKHLGEASLTFDEIFLEVEKNTGKRANGLILTDLVPISYRIRGKQNSIRKTDNLFILDADFDVFYTMESKPCNQNQELHFENLEKAAQLMCKQIKEKLPRLPGINKLFDALNLMNFCVYYFNTLKASGKIPSFNHNVFSVEPKTCPVLFPPFPSSETARISFSSTSFFKDLSKEQVAAFIYYLKQSNPQDLEKSALKTLTESLKNYIARENINQDITPEDYNALAIALLPVFKWRYQATRHSAETTLMRMQITTHANEQLSEAEFTSRIGALLQRIENDIGEIRQTIESNKQKQLPYSEESQWLLDFEKDKEALIRYKPILQKWLRDPLTAIFGDDTLVLDLVTKSLLVEKDKSSGKISIAGGCGIEVNDISAQADPRGNFLLDKYAFAFSSMPSHTMTKVEASDQGLSGFVFKLAFEDFHIVEKDQLQSAIDYLCPSHPKYPINDAITLAFHAIATQDEELFVKVADEIDDWNFRDAFGVSFIHYSASMHSPFFLQELIKRNADLQIRDNQGYTALHYAAKRGNSLCVKTLINAEPTIVNSQSDKGETPLYVSVQSNQLQIVQILLKEKIDLSVTPKHGMNILMCALHHGHEQIALEILNSRSIDIEYRLLKGKTAIHFSIEMRMDKVLRELIKQEANVNQIYGDGYRPIHLAIAHGWLNGVGILASCSDIKFDSPFSPGKTIIDFALENDQKEIAEFLQLQGHGDLFAVEKLIKENNAVALDNFQKLPKIVQNSIFSELYAIETFSKDYFGCSEHAFLEKNGLKTTNTKRLEAINRFFLKRVCSCFHENLEPQALALFNRLPNDIKECVYGNLYQKVKFTHDYYGCAEHAFLNIHNQTADPFKKSEAIEQYLLKTTVR